MLVVPPCRDDPYGIYPLARTTNPTAETFKSAGVDAVSYVQSCSNKVICSKGKDALQ